MNPLSLDDRIVFDIVETEFVNITGVRNVHKVPHASVLLMVGAADVHSQGVTKGLATNSFVRLMVVERDADSMAVTNRLSVVPVSVQRMEAAVDVQWTGAINRHSLLLDIVSSMVAERNVLILVVRRLLVDVRSFAQL